MLPFRQAIHLPFDFYHRVRFESLKGRVKLNFDNIYRGVIKVGSAGSEMFPHLCTTLIIDGDFVFSGPCVIEEDSHAEFALRPGYHRRDKGHRAQEPCS